MISPRERLGSGLASKHYCDPAPVIESLSVCPSKACSSRHTQRLHHHQPARAPRKGESEQKQPL